ncbi:MAG: hypothetical protein NW203_04220 [Hyphomonadaceae bacterium]|nr:hypothetical protein [Hyphomonadaceae bacterium]
MMRRRRHLAAAQATGEPLDLVRSMGLGAVRQRRTKRKAFRSKNPARDALNGLIEVVTRGDENAKVSNMVSPTQRYGHTGGQLWVRLGGGSTINVGSAVTGSIFDRSRIFKAPIQRQSDRWAVDKGEMYALPVTQIVGGDIYLNRAANDNRPSNCSERVL